MVKTTEMIDLLVNWQKESPDTRSWSISQQRTAEGIKIRLVEGVHAASQTLMPSQLMAVRTDFVLGKVQSLLQGLAQLLWICS